MNRLTILVDLDDVLNNQNEVWVDTLNRRYGRDVAFEDVTEWDMRLAFPGLRDNELYDPAHSGELVPYMIAPEDAVKYTEMWHKRGHKLRVVTSTSTKNAEAKVLWLCEHYAWFNRDKFIMCHNKNLIFGDILIDDALHNLKDMKWAGANPNCICVCRDKPWNRGSENEFIRAKSFEDIDSVVQQLEKGDAVEHY